MLTWLNFSSFLEISMIYPILLSTFRFPNAQGALIYPIYGQGELPQAFCRRAAVKGCIYVSSELHALLHLCG